MLQDTVLVDAGLLGTVQAERASGTRPHPAHHLDSVERLAACYSLICERQPQARVHVFLDGEGYRRLCACWQSGVAGALQPSSVKCVPFGCKVCDFLLELMQRRVADGCHVTIISNTVDVVIGSRVFGQQVSQLGFMFVDGDIVLSGLPLRRGSQTTEAAAPAWPASFMQRRANGGPLVQRTIAKSRDGRQQIAPTCTSRKPARRSPSGGDEFECETLHDSQLDGVALDDDLTDTLVVYVEEVVADTVQIAPVSPAVEAAFADTLVDIEAAAEGDQPVVPDVVPTLEPSQQRPEDQPQSPDSRTDNAVPDAALDEEISIAASTDKAAAAATCASSLAAATACQVNPSEGEEVGDAS
mmetsp:Transcript_51011/g.131516  ORF Transcript_51011/g.131516 Transcript_51011/m.131516 type:complete len:356 (-) Transcript_51011:65-1132(-)